jgi:hypothetical protein
MTVGVDHPHYEPRVVNSGLARVTDDGYSR